MTFSTNGYYRYSLEGKRYIDFDSSDSNAILGCSDEWIINAAQDQNRTYCSTKWGSINLPAENLSTALLEILGMKDGQCAFVNSGSEAKSLAIDLSRAITGRQKIIRLISSTQGSFDIDPILVNNSKFQCIPMNDLDSIKQIDFNEIAAFEFGCGRFFGLIQFPSEEFIQEIICKSLEYGFLLISDELISGFGRTGKWFDFQHYNFQPDIVMIGNTLGNGYPVGAVLITPRIAEMVDSDLWDAKCCHDNPQGCAIGLELVQMIREQGLVERAHETGIYFKQKLIRLQQEHPDEVLEIRVRGMMLSLELSPETNGKYLVRELFERGLVVGLKRNVLYFFPPLNLETNDIDLLVTEISVLMAKQGNSSLNFFTVKTGNRNKAI